MECCSLVPPRQVAGIVTEDQLYLASCNAQFREARRVQAQVAALGWRHIEKMPEQQA